MQLFDKQKIKKLFYTESQQIFKTNFNDKITSTCSKKFCWSANNRETLKVTGLKGILLQNYIGHILCFFFFFPICTVSHLGKDKHDVSLHV